MMNLNPIVKRKTHVLPALIAFTTNHLERHPSGSKRPISIHPFSATCSRSTHHTGTELAMLGDNFIHDAVGPGLVRGHDEIALHIPLDLFHGLAGVAREQ